MKGSRGIGAVMAFAMLVALPGCKKKDLSSQADARIAEKPAAHSPGTAVDPKVILEALEKPSQGAESRDPELQKLLVHHSDEAFALMDTIPPGRKRDKALRRLMANFPTGRIPALLAWLDASPREEDRSLIYVVLRRGQEVMSREQAVQLSTDLKSESLKTAMLAFVAIRSLEEGEESTEKATAFAATLPEPMRDAYLREFLSALSSKNPLRGVNEALANPEIYGMAARNASLANAGLQAPDKGQEAVLAAVNQGGDPTLAAAFVGGWLQTDSIAAGEWVSKNLSGESRDRAAVEIVRALLAQGDKEAAAKWRERIQTPKVREELPEF